MNNPKKIFQQKGAAMPEFAIVALVFFMVIFGAIEAGRWIFTWETLTEATRRGARVAAVCPGPTSATYAFIAKAAVFGDTSTVTNSPILNGLTTSMINITYYCRNGSTLFSSSCPGFPQPRPSFVEVSISGYTHNFIVPVVGRVITSPSFTTRIPIESYGSNQASPNQCY